MTVRLITLSVLRYFNSGIIKSGIIIVLSPANVFGFFITDSPSEFNTTALLTDRVFLLKSMSDFSSAHISERLRPKNAAKTIAVCSCVPSDAVKNSLIISSVGISIDGLFLGGSLTLNVISG